MINYIMTSTINRLKMGSDRTDMPILSVTMADSVLSMEEHNCL